MPYERTFGGPHAGPTVMDLAALMATVSTGAAVVAGSVAGLTYGLKRTLQESNDALRAEAEDDRRRMGDLERDLTTEREDHARTKADLEALGRVVRGEAHLVAIEGQLEDHHREMQTLARRILDAVDTVLSLIRRAP